MIKVVFDKENQKNSNPILNLFSLRSPRKVHEHRHTKKAGHCYILMTFTGSLELKQIRLHCYITGFPGGSDGKESACNAGDLGSIPGSGRSPGEGNGNPLYMPT